MTSDLGGRVAPKLSRPTGFYSTYPVKDGEAVKVGTLALVQNGEVVDATPSNVSSGGTPVMVDRGEHPIPENGETTLDNTGAAEDYEQPVTARVTHGEVFLLNVDNDIDATTSGDVWILDNDTVQTTQPASEPKVGHIVRVEDPAADTAFVLIEGRS